MLGLPRELGCLPLRFDHIRSISESVRPHRVVRIASSGPKSGWSRGVDPRMGPAERRLGGGRRSCRFARRASWLMPLRAHTRGSPRPPSIAWARQGARPARRANPRAKRPASGRERVYESATLRRAPPRIGVPFGRLGPWWGPGAKSAFAGKSIDPRGLISAIIFSSRPACTRSRAPGRALWRRACRRPLSRRAWAASGSAGPQAVRGRALPARKAAHRSGL